MPDRTPFPAAALQEIADALTLERGQEYFFHNRIAKIVRQGERYRAEVSGNTRYITHLWAAPLSGRCNCPFGGAQACKHIVALAMAVLAHNPEPELWGDSVPAGHEPPLQYLSRVNPLAERIVPEQGPDESPLEEMDRALWRYFRGEAVDFVGLAERWKWQAVPPFYAREMLLHLFEVWQKRKQQAEAKGKNLPMDWQGWQPVMAVLCVDDMVSHFLGMRLEAYGLGGLF